MVKVTRWLKTGFAFAGGLALALVGLVLMAILARPLFVVVAVAVVLGAAGYVILPRFRHWVDAKIDARVRYKGLRLASGVALHSSHSWARIFPRHVFVGADDLVQAALGPVQAVDLPQVGQRVEEGDRLFQLRRGNRSVEVRAPMTGTVVARNESLLRHPGLVNEEPFNRGWVVRLRAENIVAGRRRLRDGTAARTWFEHEIDRLMASLHGEETVATSLADGGDLVDDLYRHIDDDAWQRLTEHYFVPKA